MLENVFRQDHLRICYFGIYDPNYPRNRILIDGLKQNGVTVIECNSRAKGLKKYLELFQIHQKIKNDYDLMVVGYLGQLVMPLAKVLCRKKVVFDAFLSLYNSNIFDRRTNHRFSLMAAFYYFLDWFACRLADVILLDTAEHINYFVRTFGINPKKFYRIFIGAHSKVFQPQPAAFNPPKDLVKILWWGWIIPLHGVEFILEAAEILSAQPLKFVFIGGGKEKEKMIKLATTKQLFNVEFKEPLPVGGQELVQEIWSADICLGVFGVSSKTSLVVPNKVYETLACQKPLITAATKAAFEALADKVNCLFCQAGSGQDLALKIKLLLKDQNLKEKIAQNGYVLYQNKFNEKVLGKALFSILKNYV